MILMSVVSSCTLVRPGILHTCIPHPPYAQAYLKAPNARAGNVFGYTLSLSEWGNTLAIGSHLEDSCATGAIAAASVGGALADQV